MTREEFIKKYCKKRYFGDGLYVHFDGYHFILTAPRENGEHMVALDPFVFDNLIDYREEVYDQAQAIKE